VSLFSAFVWLLTASRMVAETAYRYFVNFEA